MADKMSDEMRQKMKRFLSDPLWAGKPFWLLNLFRLKRDANGSTAEAKAAFRRYLTSMQKYGPSMRHQRSWFEGARLVSLNCHSVFQATHGVWDCVVMYEYASPEELMKTVVGNKDYHIEAKDRYMAEEVSTQVVVKPTFLAADGIGEGQWRKAKDYADAFWEKSLDRKNKQSGDETQSIALDPEHMMSFMQSEDEDKARLKNGPIFALNFWTFKRSAEVPNGRAAYHRYAERAIEIINDNVSAPRGMAMACSPCLTIKGDIDWDEVAIMQYPNFMALARLGSQPGFQEASKHRVEGLLYQGLVLIEPQLVNGMSVGHFQVAEGGDSNGLLAPQPVIQSKL